MFSVSANQHSKILGFALAAYGFQYFPRAVRNGRTLFNEFFYSDSSPLYVLLTLPLDPVFGQFWHFLIPILAGLAILRFSGKGRYFSVLFVLSALTYFPLGTILSFYTLCYLFVISGERNFATNLSEKTS